MNKPDQKTNYVIKNFGKDFDLSYLFDRNKKRPIHRNLIKEYFDKISQIKEYSKYIKLKKDSVRSFCDGAIIAKKIIGKKELKEKIAIWPVLREAYATHGAFDALVKEHELVQQALTYLKKALDGDSAKLRFLLTPGKNFVKKDNFDLVAHIEKTEIINSLLKKDKNIEKVCLFLQEIVYAEGFLDWKLKEVLFYYDVYGMELLKELKSERLFNTNNPLEWLDKELQNRLTTL
jgi:hypothetical protein